MNDALNFDKLIFDRVAWPTTWSRLHKLYIAAAPAYRGHSLRHTKKELTAYVRTRSDGKLMPRFKVPERRECYNCGKKTATTSKVKTYVGPCCATSEPAVVQPRFIAVVISDKAVSAKRSGRPLGDWSSFLDDTKELAVQRALDACRQWGDREAQRGPYHVVVGEITEAVRVPVAFELVKL